MELLCQHLVCWEQWVMFHVYDAVKTLEHSTDKYCYLFISMRECPTGRIWTDAKTTGNAGWTHCVRVWWWCVTGQLLTFSDLDNVHWFIKRLRYLICNIPINKTHLYGRPKWTKRAFSNYNKWFININKWFININTYLLILINVY